MEEIELKDAPIKLAEGGLVLANLGGVWSVLCDARIASNMNLIRELKSRGPEKGFTILVESDARLNRYTKEVPALAWDILDTAEGALILVLPGGRNLPAESMADDGSVAIRMVHTDAGRSIVRAVNGPVACTTLLTEEGGAVTMPEQGDPKVLSRINYLLNLPSFEKPSPPRKPPIIRLGLGNEVEILRE